MATPTPHIKSMVTLDNSQTVVTVHHPTAKLTTDLILRSNMATVGKDGRDQLTFNHSSGYLFSIALEDAERMSFVKQSDDGYYMVKVTTFLDPTESDYSSARPAKF
jgi:hypothetical protein